MLRISDLLRSRSVILGLSALAALAGWGMARSYMAQASSTVKVLVAGEDIPPYYTFQANGDPKVKVGEVPKLAVRRGTFTDAAQIAGRMTRSVIPAGTPVSAPYLAGESDGKGGSLAKSLRDAGRNPAISWSFSYTDAVAGRIAAGDKVDVLISTRGSKDAPPTITTIAGVTVLDVMKPDEKTLSTGSGQAQVTIIFEEKANASPQGGAYLSEALMNARANGHVVFLRLLPAEGGGKQ